MDAVRNNLIPGVGPVASPRPAQPAAPEDGPDSFAALLRRQLDEVSRVQRETDQGIENLLTGRSDNLTEVFATARKAEVAFGLLMEIRNKLVDAYNEIRQLRV
ncbi:MAG: flagellar hook-basal body complex protein FliE [Phycisphaerales bacterium]|nr:flagellar hook-basal body complex protein FliE [Phycisphaerales bacterium]